jgi:hypothetical protein
MIVRVAKHDDVACESIVTCALIWSKSAGANQLQNGPNLGDEKCYYENYGVKIVSL